MSASTGRLKGQVAIVTGGGGGIGRAEALQLAQEGAKVVVNDLPRGEPTSAEKVVQEIRNAGGEAVAVNASVSRMEGAAAIVHAAIDTYGRLDILVNNAGFGRMAPIWEMTEAEWDSVIAVNLKGSFAMIRHAAAHFRAQGGGVIVNTSSDAGTGDTYMDGYSAAKEGLVGLTRAVARDLARDGVRCNAIRPRAFDTGQSTAGGLETHRRFFERFGTTISGRHPLGPAAGTAAEVAAFVAWLCTDAAKSINGRIFLIGCGEAALWEEPKIARAIVRDQPWDLDGLMAQGEALTQGLLNEPLALPDEAWAVLDTRIESHHAHQSARKAGANREET